MPRLHFMRGNFNSQAMPRQRPSLSRAYGPYLAVKVCLLFALISSIYLTIRRGVAAWYFREDTPQGIQTAMKWDPANPRYHDALATFLHLYADHASSAEIMQLYQKAAELSPHNAEFQADLGEGFDWAGRPRDALAAFRDALELSPNSPQINWELANFYVRTGDGAQALRCLHTVLLGNASAQNNVFALAVNTTRDSRAILDMLPLRASILFDYLDFQSGRGDLRAAEQAWNRILQSNLPFNVRDPFPYLDALIRGHEIGQLTEVWSGLTQRFPSESSDPPPAQNLIYNGDFTSEVFDGGLDWRIFPMPGVDASVEMEDQDGGGRALRVNFAGTSNPNYANVLQFVPVQPHTRYRFSARMRVNGITTDSGPRFQICDAYKLDDVFASTENLTGNSDWVEELTQFTTHSDTQLVLVRIARPKSNKFDNEISGTLWVSRVKLIALHGAR